MVVEENCERLALEKISSGRERKTQGYPFESGMVRCFGSSAETQALENVQGARDDAKISSSGASNTTGNQAVQKTIYIEVDLLFVKEALA